jgi:hypothetical protein
MEPSIKLKDLIVALYIIDALPFGKARDKAIEDLFKNDMKELDLPLCSFDYHSSSKRGIRMRRFSYKPNDKDLHVKFMVFTGRNERIFIRANLDKHQALPV